MGRVHLREIPAPSAFGRTVLSLGLLVGFYASSLLLVVALVAPSLVLGRVAALASAIPALFVLRGMWLVRPPRLDAPREPIDPAEAPELYVLVEELAAAIPIAPPADIFLTSGSSVKLAENATELFVGAPLLATSTVAELRTIIARELGHVVFGRVAIVAWAHDAFHAVLTEKRFGSFLPRQYARLYFSFTCPSDRRAAVAADLLAAQLAKPAAKPAAALVDIELDAFLTESPAESGVMRRRAPSSPEHRAAS